MSEDKRTNVLNIYSSDSSCRHVIILFRFQNPHSNSGHRHLFPHHPSGNFLNPALEEIIIDILLGPPEVVLYVGLGSWKQNSEQLPDRY